MATHTVKRVGPWFETLAATILAAKEGDVVVVDDMHMMEYACFGVRSRGLTTLSEKGIRVHLADAPGVSVDVEKGRAVGTGPSAASIRKEWAPADETGRWLCDDVVMVIEPDGYFVTAHTPNGDVTVTRDGKPVPFERIRRPVLRRIVEFANNPRLAGTAKTAYPDDTKFGCQACAREYTFVDAKTAFEGQTDVLPLCFCSVACADRYRARHKGLPPVAAEIIL